MLVSSAVECCCPRETEAADELQDQGKRQRDTFRPSDAPASDRVACGYSLPEHVCRCIARKLRLTSRLRGVLPGWHQCGPSDLASSFRDVSRDILIGTHRSRRTIDR